MKILILLLITTSTLGQTRCPDDMWSTAIIVGDEPKEIQVGPGVAYRVIVIERKDTTKTESWVISKKGTTIPTPTTPVLKATVNDQNSPIVYDPGWQKIPANPSAAWLNKFNGGDVTLQYTTGVWASYKFRGRRIELIAEKCDNHGKAKVEILKGTTVVKSDVVDMYQSTGTATNPATSTNWCPNGVVTAVYSSGDLPLDDYTVRFNLDSKDMTKVPARDSFVFDAIKVYE